MPASERSGLPLDPVLLSRQARLAARERRRRAPRARRGLAAPGHGRRVPHRPPRRALRHRPLDRVAHPAARASAGATGTSSCCRRFGLRREWLPALGPTFGSLGELRHERWPAAMPLTAQLVDQQAALAGSGAVRPGELKATYGTGVFVLGTHREPGRARAGCCRRSRGPRRTRATAESARSPTRSTAACSRRARCSTGSPDGLGLRRGRRGPRRSGGRASPTAPA